MGRLLRALALGLALWGVAVHTGAAEPVIVVARVDGVIDPINAQYLARVLREAEATRAELLVIELNTPGGLVSAMETMTQMLLASAVPTVVYVTPTGARAGSAGVFIAMAADIVAMAPGTVIGAAHPVSLGGGQMDPVVAEKATNYAAAYARTLATTKGHNADWAEQAVRASVVLTEQEALGQGVIDLVARDSEELLGQLQGRRVVTAGGVRVLPPLTGASMQRYPPNPTEVALKLIAEPNIALLLLIVGFIGIIAELYHPGAFFPGITGAISLLLAFVALGNLPTNWGAAALISFSLVLFLLELHMPSHGVLGIGGVIAFLLGGFLLFAPMTPVAPVFVTVEVNRWLLVAASAALAAFFLLALRAGLRARRMPVAGQLVRLAGARGVATSTVAPAGTVLVLHEQWSAVTEGEAIGPGEVVEVIAREGLRLRVRRVASPVVGELEAG
jgi:membrane-bound serine protease (ClpP class)